jgi:hypothetical protein
MRNSSVLEATDLTIDQLVLTIAKELVDNTNLYPFFLEHAMRSNKLGYNPYGWCKIAEASAKGYVLSMKDSRLLTDSFILRLAVFLSEYFYDHVKGEG